MDILLTIYQAILTFSTIQSIIILSVLFVLLVLALRWREKRLKLDSKKFPIPETQYTYHTNDVISFFKHIGTNKIRFYQWSTVTLDLIFPVTYSLLLAAPLRYLYSASLLTYILICIPLLGGVADLIENVAFFSLCKRYLKLGEKSDLSKTVGLAMVFTRLKFVLVSLAIIAILAGIVMKFSPYLFALRSPIVFGLIIFLFPIVANTAGKTLFQNLFALDNIWQIGSVVFGAVMSAFMIAFETQQFLEHSSGSNLPIHISKIHLLEITGVLIIPTLICIFLRSKYETRKSSITMGFLGGGTISAVFIYLILYLIPFLNKLHLAQFPIFELLSDVRAFIIQNPEDFSFGLSFWLLGCLVYMLTLYLYRPRQTTRSRFQFLNDPPALLYVFLLAWLWSGLFGFFTFFLDPYHVPVIIGYIAFSGLMYLAFEVDHFYDLVRIFPDSQEPKKKQNESDRVGQMKNFKQALRNRLSRQTKPQKTLVVVAASGGGIQAAGWTALVLCGLQKDLGESFTQAIGLISSVSGGSVGAMNFIDCFDPKASENPEAPKRGCPIDDRALDTIFDNSTRDNLDAVGWGLAGPDFARFIGLPFLVSDKFNDRGYAIETDWKAHMKNPDSTLSSWREQILRGEIPIPVFNATLVEDGKRYLISPMTFLKDIKDADTKKAFDFNTLFNSIEHQESSDEPSQIYDLDVTTAARLSASFPFVSPISRNYGNFNFNYHVTDGGYFDNSGMFTAIEWIDEHSEMLAIDLKVQQIILIQINATPEPKSEAVQKGGKGWFMEWIGPLQAVYTVRDSTLLSRNSREVKLLNCSKSNISIKSFIFSFPSNEDFRHHFPKNGNAEQPLSWKLTRKQKSDLKKGWEIIKSTEDYLNLQELWRQHV